MTEKVFKGVINGKEFTDAKEFYKTLQEHDDENLTYTCSYEEKTVEEEPKAEVHELEPQKDYSVEELLKKIFDDYSKVFGRFDSGKLTKEYKPTEEPHSIDKSHFIKNVNLDDFDGSLKDQDKLFDLSNELDKLSEELFALSEKDLLEVTTKFDNYYNQITKKIERAKDRCAAIEEEQKELEDRMSELDKKFSVLNSCLTALTRLQEYYAAFKQ